MGIQATDGYIYNTYNGSNAAEVKVYNWNGTLIKEHTNIKTYDTCTNRAVFDIRGQLYSCVGAHTSAYGLGIYKVNF